MSGPLQDDLTDTDLKHYWRERSLKYEQMTLDLRALVKDAYFEGWEDAMECDQSYRIGASLEFGKPSDVWPQSDACAALAAGEGEM